MAVELEAREERIRLGMEPRRGPVFGDVAQQWAATGGAAASYRDQMGRLRAYVLPEFGTLRMGDITPSMILAWLDRMKAAGKLKPGTMRHALNLVSRIFTWAIKQGHDLTSPVRLIPSALKPIGQRKETVRFLGDDDVVAGIFRSLPEPVRYLFILGHRCGVKMGEAARLRLSDMGAIDDGRLRVRFTNARPWSKGDPSPKILPGPGVVDGLREWLGARRSAGAKDEDLAFPTRTGGIYGKDQCSAYFRASRFLLGLGDLKWEEATVVSFRIRLGRQLGAWLTDNQPEVIRQILVQVGNDLSRGTEAVLGANCTDPDAREVTWDDLAAMLGAGAIEP